MKFSPMTSWLQSDGPHVVYADDNENVNQLWYTILTGTWAAQSLMNVPNAVQVGPGSPMTSWVQSDGPHFVYADVNGNLTQFWYTVGTGQWAAQSLMNVPNAVPVGLGSPMTSWVQADGPHFVYADLNGNVCQLWYTQKTGQWNAQSLMTVPNVAAAGWGSPMTSWVQADGPHVVYADANGNVCQLWYREKTGQWAAQSLMNVPNAVTVGPGSPMTSWVQSDGPHFVYADANGNLTQFWYTTLTRTWAAQSLMNVPNAVPLGPGSPMTSWVQSDGPHFVYADANGDLTQFWYTTLTRTWAAQSLMNVPNAVPVGPGGAMTSWVQSDGPHFVYADANGNLTQLWYTIQTRAWAAQILLTAQPLGIVWQQQQQNNWCWAAVTSMVSEFYHPSSRWNQCAVATATINQWRQSNGLNSVDCCDPKVAPTGYCNVTWGLLPPLQISGNFASMSNGTIDFAAVESQTLFGGRPVCVQIAWSGGGGHFIVVDGASVDGALADWLHVEDPAYGPGDYLYSDVATKYQGSGTWVNTFLTKP
jgi:hypothetical protein